MRKVFGLFIAATFALGFLVPSIVTAAKKDHRQGRVIFTPNDRRVITQYYRGTSNLPPGLAKRGGNLPPGLQKHIRQTGHLPPGLERGINPFPADLERRLPTLPPTYRRGIVGDRAVIYNPNSNAIQDMIRLFTGVR